MDQHVFQVWIKIQMALFKSDGTKMPSSFPNFTFKLVKHSIMGKNLFACSSFHQLSSPQSKNLTKFFADFNFNLAASIDCICQLGEKRWSITLLRSNLDMAFSTGQGRWRPDTSLSDLPKSCPEQRPNITMTKDTEVPKNPAMVDIIWGEKKLFNESPKPIH